LLWVYENALRDECGYKGAQPYWDWSLDVPENGGAQFNASPVFDPVTGFGGNGANGSVPTVGIPPPGLIGEPLGSCINNGPFANFTVILDPGPPPANDITAGHRCLKRNFQINNSDVSLGWQSNVVPLLNLTGFANFTGGFDRDVGNTGSMAGVHGGGHLGVGGEVSGIMLFYNSIRFTRLISCRSIRC
jgi:tyrosinase